MNLMSARSLQRAAAHVAFWVLLFLVLYSSNTARSGHLSAFWFSLIAIGMGVATVYTHYFVLIPRLYERKKYGMYALATLLLVLFSVTVALLTIANAHFQHQQVFTLVKFTGGVFILLGGSSVMRFAEMQADAQKHTIELKNATLRAELNFLKSQINPHFLFNTLNNVYTLAYLKDDRAAPMIAKLSGLMRYMLHDAQADKVPLTSELEFLRHYIDLHLLKTDDQRSVDFYQEGVFDEHAIAPLLLINFIENCFKHSNFVNLPEAWIKISCVVKGDKLIFKAKNSMSPNPVKSIDSGIGLQNVKNRLELLYPRKHTLLIQERDLVFKVKLKIQL